MEHADLYIHMSCYVNEGLAVFSFDWRELEKAVLLPA